ncbi:MAG TPA: pyrroloquinoline quinone-dependent dehydrogenase [Acidobacteriaceae bacterium]|nr:pyrroloquinoline quinone-dependent dehydrogenase [Acidobacteriaceae bacterium]
MRQIVFGAACVSVGLFACWATSAQAPARVSGRDAGWTEYGGSLGGQRYSAARQIDRGNLSRLEKAWTVDVRQYEGAKPRGSFEATPVLWRGTLYLTTPKDVVLAVDAATGKVRWTFDPQVKDEEVHYIATSRGVALWHEARRGACADRVLIATLDRRLIALDARTGELCRRFGDGGTVDLGAGLYVPGNPQGKDYLEFTSPPVIVGDRVILGSAVADNQSIDTPSGAVRAFDVRTGKQLWKWEPLEWMSGPGPHASGAGNAWAPLAADREHDLVFVPTGSASVDYYGGTRVGDNHDADSIVALRASTGEKVWAFQLVHHNLWDYDTASQPLLFTWHGNVPAVAVMNKTGMIYVFNRLTGEPLFPIAERPVPQTDVPGEKTWATQPFSSVEPLLSMRFGVDRMPAGRGDDERFCRRLMGEVKYDGPFTAPSMQGTVIYPASLGGPNWGSSALDVKTGVMYTRVNSMAYLVWLTKGAKEVDAAPKKPARNARDELKAGVFRPPDAALGGGGNAMGGTPYAVNLRALVGPGGTPCGGAPYGRVVATDLNSGKQLWSVPHGEMLSDIPGSVGMGGPIVTAGGVVFVGASRDAALRAYDARTGKELWKGELPATPSGTPMTYVAGGRQYVVIATGDDRHSDALVAFALGK